MSRTRARIALCVFAFALLGAAGVLADDVGFSGGIGLEQRAFSLRCAAAYRTLKSTITELMRLFNRLSRIQVGGRWGL